MKFENIKNTIMKKLVLSVAILFSTLMLFAENENKEAAKSSFGEVQGLVYELVNNEKVALPLAEICIGTEGEITTDLSGNFVLSLNPGKHNVTFQFDGYKLVTKEVKLEGSDKVFLEVELVKEANFAQKK